MHTTSIIENKFSNNPYILIYFELKPRLNDILALESPIRGSEDRLA